MGMKGNWAEKGSSQKETKITKIGNPGKVGNGTNRLGGTGHDFWDGAGLRFQHSARLRSGHPALRAGAVSSLARFYGRLGGRVWSARQYFLASGVPR